MDAALRDKYTTIANLLIQQVGLEQIGMIVGLSPGRISQIKDEPEFQELFSALAAKHAEENKEMDEGWDTIEKQSMAVLMDNLRWNKNPDFALRAAAIANKAQRRARQHNPAPIDAGQAGTRVVINLNGAFVAKLQKLAAQQTVQPTVIDGKAEDTTSIENLPKKQNNMLLPSQVEQMLFQPEPKTVKQEVAAIFDDVDVSDRSG